MITRSKLAEQLREQQIRSHNKSPLLNFFSPKPLLTSWGDVGVAIVFSMVVIASYVTFGLRQLWVSPLIMLIGISLVLRMRQAVAPKKDTRFLLPLSM